MGNTCSSNLERCMTDLGRNCCSEEEHPDVHDDRYDVDFSSEAVEQQPRVGFFDQMYPGRKERKPIRARKQKSRGSELSSIESPRGADFEGVMLVSQVHSTPEGELSQGVAVLHPGHPQPSKVRQKSDAENRGNRAQPPKSDSVDFMNMFASTDEEDARNLENSNLGSPTSLKFGIANSP
eukprot:GEMP01028387.1.p1 GENE.GEMP01028387.1~~GEMP01028387.1.p1  ORF type:complete len:180 (+),score=26.81 GEMP01028387.1:66-605(+)